MTGRPPSSRVRAERLLRWYPTEWRARFGDEFRELLISEINDRPRCLHRSVDIAVGGLTARLADAGLVSSRVNSPRQSQRSLVTFGWAIAVFMTIAVSIWSQLNIARSWSEPTASSTHTAIVIMTTALFACLAVASIAAVPVALQTAVSVCRSRTPRIWRPALLCAVGTAIMVFGGLYFRNGWAGSAPHSWPHPPVGQGPALGFLWASTLAVSAYWAHPTILLSFPLSEITWMVVSPLALTASIGGAARTVRRLDLSPRMITFTGYVARAISLGMLLFLFGTLVWLIDGTPGPSNLFQAGTVDFIGLALMAIALGVAARSAHRIASQRALTTG